MKTYKMYFDDGTVATVPDVEREEKLSDGWVRLNTKNPAATIQVNKCRALLIEVVGGH